MIFLIFNTLGFIVFFRLLYRGMRLGLYPPGPELALGAVSALPWLYLQGISTGDMCWVTMQKGLSPALVSRIKAQWAEDYRVWNGRDLSQERMVYVWADGIYSILRGEDDRLCLLVIIGVSEQGERAAQYADLNDCQK